MLQVGPANSDEPATQVTSDGYARGTLISQKQTGGESGQVGGAQAQDCGAESQTAQLCGPHRAGEKDGLPHAGRGVCAAETTGDHLPAAVPAHQVEESVVGIGVTGWCTMLTTLGGVCYNSAL